MSSNLNDLNGSISELIVISTDQASISTSQTLSSSAPTVALRSRRKKATSTSSRSNVRVTVVENDDLIDLTKDADDPCEIAVIQESRPQVLKRRQTFLATNRNLDASIIIDDHSDDIHISPPKQMRTCVTSVAHLPTNNNNDSLDRSDEPKCPICLDNLKELKLHGKNLMSTFCGHIVCNMCVDEHFKASQLKSKTITCPTCRTKITRNKIHPLYL